jgi:hypothetical protein
MASQPPGKTSVLNFDALCKSGLVKLNEKALKRQLLQAKQQQLITRSSPAANNENVRNITIGANVLEINKKGFLVPVAAQPVRTLHTLDYSRAFHQQYNANPRSTVMKSLINNKLVHTLTGTPDQQGSGSGSGPKPITYARELAVSLGL